MAKSTAAPALWTSATKPRNPNGSSCSRRKGASAAIGMSRLLAFCSTAWVSSGCGESSPKTRYPSSSAACTAAANRTV